jgi:hypothetical protein
VVQRWIGGELASISSRATPPARRLTVKGCFTGETRDAVAAVGLVADAERNRVRAIDARESRAARPALD